MNRRFHSPDVLSIVISFAVALHCAVPALADFQFVHAGHSYLTVTTPRNWANAAADAVTRQFAGATGELARIDNQAENDAIFAALLANIPAVEFANTDAADGGGGAYVWIGASDLTTEGTWLWDGAGDGSGDQFWQGNQTGAAVGGLYNNWGRTAAQNEPDNFPNPSGRGGGDQDAAAISLNGWPLGSASQWNDVARTDLLYYLVEFQVVPEPGAVILLLVSLATAAYMSRHRSRRRRRIYPPQP